jgi:DNA/RNA endonuclease G (NUC1)
VSYRIPGYGYGGGGGVDVKSFVVGALVGAAVGGGAVYKSLEVSKVEKAEEGAEVVEVVGRKKKKQRAVAAYDEVSDDAAAAHPAMQGGWPVSTESLLRVHTSYVASFDARTRNPRWVLEVLNKNTCEGPGNRKHSNFIEDAVFGERFRNKLADFRGSGYDRGGGPGAR